MQKRLYAGIVSLAVGLLIGQMISLGPRKAIAQDATVITKVYTDHGGDQLNVKSGGLIKVYAGGTIDSSAGTMIPPFVVLSTQSLTVANLTATYNVSAATASFTATGGAVKVSSSATSGVALGLCGAFQTLPTSGYPKGCLAIQLSDLKLYLSTNPVTEAGSWQSVGSQ